MKLLVADMDERLVPYYQTDDAAGLDLVASYPEEGDEWFIPAGGDAIIECGIDIAIPSGCVGLVSIRSGHGFKKKLIAHDGRIDADYRGPVKVEVFNVGKEDQVIKTFERFAQLVIVPYVRVEIERVVDVGEAAPTKRDKGGYGSTGA